MQNDMKDNSSRSYYLFIFKSEKFFLNLLLKYVNPNNIVEREVKKSRLPWSVFLRISYDIVISRK